jgi:hypothetical protein
MTEVKDNSVLRLVQALAPAVSYKESNLETNRKVWNLYAKVLIPIMQAIAFTPMYRQETGDEKPSTIQHDVVPFF